MCESPMQLVLGLLSGIAFGFLLQKGRVTKYEVILGQLLLRDWTVIKIMLTAIIVGSIGVYALIISEVATLHIRPFTFAGLLIGGACFGTGMALLGYCPGTTVAACGEGRRDAMVGVVGMLFGASVYVALYGSLQQLAAGLGDWGKITLPDVTGIHFLAWILGSIVVFLLGIALGNRAKWQYAAIPERFNEDNKVAGARR